MLDYKVTSFHPESDEFIKFIVKEGVVRDNTKQYHQLTFGQDLPDQAPHGHDWLHDRGNEKAMKENDIEDVSKLILKGILNRMHLMAFGSSEKKV
nr:hypothetical protein CFP56_74722 [Quercus suber]